MTRSWGGGNNSLLLLLLLFPYWFIIIIIIMWWEVIKFGIMQCFGGLLSGGASFAAPIAFLGLLWSRIFRSPSFSGLVRIAAILVILGTGVVTYWQQRAILKQLEETEKIAAEGSCFRHVGCEKQKTQDPANRYHEVHDKQCNVDKWRCENSAEDRAWYIWVHSIPGWLDILHTLESKFILVACLTLIVSFILPWFSACWPARAANTQFVAIGNKQLRSIIQDHTNPEGYEPLHED